MGLKTFREHGEQHSRQREPPVLEGEEASVASEGGTMAKVGGAADQDLVG